MRVEPREEIDSLVLGDVSEGPFDVTLEIAQSEFVGIDHDRSRLDLRQVKNVAPSTAVNIGTRISTWSVRDRRARTATVRFLDVRVAARALRRHRIGV
jgi:hypothetical protein